jgi:hypothetical protein
MQPARREQPCDAFRASPPRFSTDPERCVYNNAVLARDLAASERADAVSATENAYAAAGFPRFAAWVHESDAAMRSDLDRRGYTHDDVTRAMARHRNHAEARRGDRRMTDPRGFYTRDKVFGSLPTKGGQGGPPTVVNGRTGSGGVIPVWLKVRAVHGR